MLEANVVRPDAQDSETQAMSNGLGQCLPILQGIRQELSRHLHGKDRVIDAMMAAILAQGHVLLEDVPGVGKTTVAHCLAHALGLSFKRIQFTSDTLPSDVLGVTIFQGIQGSFHFQPGPVFANIVLADEINRSPARTQSALLEAMERAMVSIDRQEHVLPSPFFVIATQNPVDFDSTYPLPVAQLDRFTLRLSIGYPDKASEVAMLGMRDLNYDELKIKAAISLDSLKMIQRSVKDIFVDPSLLEYMQEVAVVTRKHPDLAYGVSTRGLRLWKLIAQSVALLNGRSYVIPDDLLKFSAECLAHRVRLKTEDLSANAALESAGIVNDVVQRTPMPHVKEGRRG